MTQGKKNKIKTHGGLSSLTGHHFLTMTMISELKHMGTLILQICNCGIISCAPNTHLIA